MKHLPLAWLIGTLACSAAQEQRPVARSLRSSVADAGSGSISTASTREQTAPAAAHSATKRELLLDASGSSTSAPSGARSMRPAAAELEALLGALPPASRSTSIGSPTNGRLEGGLALPLSGPGFRYNDRRSREARFGTVEVVRAIARAAFAVADELPGSELVVNDISLESGGRISHHGSHRAGRDADVLFYLLDDRELPIASVGAPLEPDGTGHDYKDLALLDDDVRVHLDAPRTWRFVRALLEDPEAEVQRIFVVEHLRARLLSEAERSNAPAAVIARFADVSCQPGYPHDDHLHVRWFCSVEDLRAGCEDAAPLYPWREQKLRAAGVTSVLAKRARSEDPAPIVTQADAEREVKRQQPHASVLSFLERRKSWERQPHPQRPYCR